MEPPTIHQDSPAWILFVYVSFLLSLSLMCLGIDLLLVSLWIKGYFVMGLFFLTGSTLTLSKTVRDQHEARRLVNRVSQAKTEEMLNRYEMKP